MAELSDVQKEIEDVKKALRGDGSYLGMRGENLQQYFLQLNKRENLLLSVAAGVAGTSESQHNNEPPTNQAADGSIQHAVFDRNDISAVVRHLCEQAADPIEAARGLRALTSLAYANPLMVGENSEALSMVRRLVYLYADDDALQLAAISVLCNVADDPTVAQGTLSDPKLLAMIIRAAAKNPGSASLRRKGSETIARIVHARGSENSSVLSALFLAVTVSDGGPAFLAKVLSQLIRDGVININEIAQQLAAASDALSGDTVGAERLVELLNQLSPNSKIELPTSPSGRADQGGFDKSDLTSVLAYISHNIGLASDAARGMRALASLAYADPPSVGGKSQVYATVRQAMYLHPDDEALQLAAIRSLCNMAYAPTNAVGTLSDPKLLAMIFRAVARNQDSSKLYNLAIETIARILLAWGSELAGILSALMLAATASEGGAGFMVKLFTQLIANVDLSITVEHITQQVLVTMDALAEDNVGILRLLELLRLLSVSSAAQQQSLINAGTAQRVSAVMSRQLDDAAVQLAGIEAFKALTQSKWDTPGLPVSTDIATCKLLACGERFLPAFMPRITVAMCVHRADLGIQLQGVQALTLGIEFSDEMRRQADWVPRRAVELTKDAMTEHSDNVAIQLCGLHAMCKYIECGCGEEVQTLRGMDLACTAITKHQDNLMVKTLAANVQRALGASGPATSLAR